MKQKMMSIFLILFIGLGFVMPQTVKAAGATISISNSKSLVVTGSTFTTTVTVSSSSPLGAWNFDLKYDTAKLQLVSSSFGGTYVVDYGNGTKKSATYTFTFKAKASGTASLYIANSKVLAYDESNLSVSNGSSSIKCMTQAELEETYSKNNYLSGLSIEGATLSPNFSKDTLEYKVELENNITSINVKATAEDWRSKITGSGAVSVSEGQNKIEIKVTAENGNVRTYIINATVKELSPVTVKVNGEDYTVIRKKENLTMPSNFTETTVTIQGETIPGFYNEITKYTLVGLKNKAGEIGLYIYNSDTETYILYQETIFNRLIFQILDFPSDKIPNNYEKVTTTLQGKEIIGYRMNSASRYTLIYGRNMETGNEGIYVYDNLEETLQRYDNEQGEITKKKDSQYLIILLALGSTCVVLLGILMGVIISKVRHKNPKVKKEKKVEEKTSF